MYIIFFNAAPFCPKINDIKSYFKEIAVPPLKYVTAVYKKQSLYESRRLSVHKHLVLSLCCFIALKSSPFVQLTHLVFKRRIYNILLRQF